MNAIEIRNISKSYGFVTDMEDFSILVGGGDLFGLIGLVGAVKTTMFRILATLLDPDQGNATVAGLDIGDSYRSIRSRIGYMPGRFSLYPDLSVRENLNFFASLFNVTVADNHSMIAPIYSQIEPFASRKAGKLSGGMKQKLALCCALIHKPEVLFLDEPTTGVDAVSRQEFWDMLDTLKATGITIMVSTPYMDEAVRCDRAALISRGRIMATDTPGRLAEFAGDNIYSAAAQEMWPLLLALREMPDVADCYTFGATHHLVATAGFNVAKATETLHRQGLHDVRINPVKGNIEDMFIRLMKNG